MVEIKNLELKKAFYNTLNERQRRHFVAIEAKYLGHGGITKVSECFGVHRETIRIGISELESGDTLKPGRIRREGGGAKKKL